MVGLVHEEQDFTVYLMQNVEGEGVLLWVRTLGAKF